jgi:hypothetical protein
MPIASAGTIRRVWKALAKARFCAHFQVLSSREKGDHVGRRPVQATSGSIECHPWST